MDEERDVTISEHIFDQLSCLSGTGDAQLKIKTANTLKPYLGELDGYLSFSDGNCQGQLPSLDWNAHFRKAYSLLFWIRPVLGAEKETTIAEDNSPSPKRWLYRFSTSHDNAGGVGIAVAVGDWRVTRDSSTSKRVVHTTLTAFSLPHVPTHTELAISLNDNATPYVSAPLRLLENEWALVGITHVFPYLKRPFWTLCVNGKVESSGELVYPVLDRSPIMQFNTMFENIVQGGATMLDDENDTPDHQKTASELQTRIYAKRQLSLHLASYCLSNDVLSSTVQALIAQAGPTLSLQQNGALPTLPPVANWTKGSSLEGPNVGIPLVVHGQALQVQQLAGSCVLWGSAVEARLLGAAGSGRGHRIVCRMPPQLGTTHTVPRVGLIQPTPPSPHPSQRMDATDEDMPVSLTVIGSCSVHHNLSDYLLKCPSDVNIGTHLFNSSKYFSLILEAQALDIHLLLPFFLAMPPPGKVFDLQDSLYQDSLKHLYSLFSNNGKFAGLLLELFAISVRNGGGRWHELLLQNGSMHVLTASLRQALVRADVLRVYEYDSLADFLKATKTMPRAVARLASLPVSPRRIPMSVATACCSIIDSCCGPPCALLEDLPPAYQIQRTSDLALTSLFAFALDLELWGGDLRSCSRVLKAVALRYGGACVTAGYIIRSQISVQFFLDIIKCQLDRDKPSAELEAVADPCGEILLAMILSSLSNNRSISQGENDVAACMGALSDFPLGSVGAHVIFHALMGVLQWAEVFPSEKVLSGVDDEHKMQVAHRLGRNLMSSQFHDVVAPMLLSRTVFSGERSMKNSEQTTEDDQYDGKMSWREHWKQCLFTFSWVASIASADGLIAAKSLGSLLLASGVAGSLRGALSGPDASIGSTLFLPPPSLAMSLASTSRQSEWNYNDLLSERLQAVIPLLPGLVLSILPLPSGSNDESNLTQDMMTTMSALITAASGAIYRVHGGSSSMSSKPSKPAYLRGSLESIFASSAVKAAKEFVPNLLVVAVVLEYHIMAHREGNDDDVELFATPSVVELTKRVDESWMEVTSTGLESKSESLGLTVSLEAGSYLHALVSCQRTVLSTLIELIVQAMKIGGGEVATMLVRILLKTLEDTTTYTLRQNSSSADKDVADNMLCCVVSLLLIGCLRRSHNLEVWDDRLASSVSKLAILIEERQLLKPSALSNGDEKLRGPKCMLLCSLLYVLEYGRDVSGWCQLVLPSPPGSQVDAALDDAENDDEGTSAHPALIPGSSKVLLPVLVPSLRLVIDSLRYVSPTTTIRVPLPSGSGGLGNLNMAELHDKFVSRNLFEFVVAELEKDIVAAIVGLSFPTGRDFALQALASLRKALTHWHEASSSDMNAANLCRKLMIRVADELKVRYHGERRRREVALFDAYQDEEASGDRGELSAKETAAADSQAIENLILGGNILSSPIVAAGAKPSEPIEEVTFDDGTRPPSHEEGQDFVLFHEAYADGSGRTIDENKARMAWSSYEGLGLALEKCGSEITEMQVDDNSSKVGSVLRHIGSYLDAWDGNAAREDEEEELVGLFDFALNDSPNEAASEHLGHHFPIPGSETAADAMTTFIEFAAVEKSRYIEVAKQFLPNHRNSCVSYAERYGWARYIETTKLRGEGLDALWERGIADGNRDIRSRLVSIPCMPQFKRYIPSYLDHGTDVSTAENGEPSDSIDNAAPGSHDHAHPRPSAAEADVGIDQFTKTLLETGHVEIVDITKKEIVDEEEPDMSLAAASSLDDDGMFDETPMESPMESDESMREDNPKLDAHSSTVTTDNTSFKDSEESFSLDKIKLGSTHFNITSSAFASPPDNSSSTLSLMHSAAANMIEAHLENCLHVKAEGSRKCSLLLTATHLILEYDVEAEGLFEGEMMAVHEEAERQKLIESSSSVESRSTLGDKIEKELAARHFETAALRPKSIRWNLSELSHVYLRRYRLRDSSLEMFFIPSGGASFGGYGLFSPSTSLFLDFGPGREGVIKRDDAAFAIMKRAPPQAIKQWPDRAGQFLHEQLNRLTIGWVEGRITNFDYLLHLNMLAGRSYNDICQYPVMPWVLSDYRSEEIPDLRDIRSFRDLTKPMGALNPDRLEDFIERFNTFADPSIPPFMYGSHYSTSAGVVLHFLVRLHPYAGLHRQLQGGHFDVADRLFSSVPKTWDMCTGSSAAEVKELTPEFYSCPSFLKNKNKFKLGTSQDGEVLGDVELPPWAKGKPETFIEVMRNALESDICSEMLPDWIDLIFGRKQQGPEAIAAHNVFFYLTYYGSVDVASIEDESLRQATELQIAHFGQCPMQLFIRPHVRRISSQNYRRLSFYQILSAYTNGAGRENEDRIDRNAERMNRVFGEPFYLPFFSSPMSHWVQLDAPPPGPHANLISVRLAGTDRCLAVDSRGVFHCFRWAWKATDDRLIEGVVPGSTYPLDDGCFVAQRELPRFRSVPRLCFTPRSGEIPAVAVSKTLFAGRSVLLVLSDGDGRGSLAMQLVDPAKGSVRGEAVVQGVHSAQVSCIHTDPIGTAAGHGGVGGELAIVGSFDGTASIWRFMSSHYLPLRPRVRLSGHGGRKISGVTLSASINVAATVSSERCCLHSIGNGNVIRVIEPPRNTLDLPTGSDLTVETFFADTPAVAISVQGFICTVCETKLSSTSSSASKRSVITLHLFSLEGVSLGSKPLESWRGVPHKMSCTPDGTAVMVCSGRGVTIHRLSAITPLEFIDEWHITEADELTASVPHAWDVDFGPSLNRPVVAAAACSNGVLRLHALAGISTYSVRHQRGALSQSVGTALARPARRIRTALGKGLGIGTKMVDVGKEIGKEVSTDVKEKGVSGFLGSMFRKSSS